MYYGTPPIVTNGLVLNLDAANTKSYVSGSTVWRDVSGNGYTGSIFNSPSFDTNNGGSIVFNGSTTYMNLGITSAFTTPTVFSIGMWFNATDTSLEQVLWGTTPPYTAGYTVGLYASKFLFQGYTSNGIVGGAGSVLANNTWHNMLYTYTSGASSFYLNGRLHSSVGGSTIFTTPTVSTQIGRYVGSSGGGSFSGKIAQIQYYNRALTQAEILQNYNALKSRFI